MKAFTILLLIFTPIFVFGQKETLKDGEIFLKLAPEKGSDGKPGLNFVVKATKSITDSLFKYNVSAKGDTLRVYLPNAKGEKMYHSDIFPSLQNYPHYIALYIVHKGKRKKLAEWQISYKDGKFSVFGAEEVKVRVE